MLLSETYKRRLLELAGMTPNDVVIVVEASEVQDPYAASHSRVKFDMNLMKQAIEGGIEVGLIFQSDNDKYKMPIWKTRIIWPFAMGYDRKGQLVIRAVHVEGQSEKKALETDPRKGSAQATNEWRLFKVVNIKSMFYTGGYFQGPPSGIKGAYKPDDSAMTNIIINFDPKTALEYQKNIKAGKTAPKPKKAPIKPIVKPGKKTTAPNVPKAPVAPAVPKLSTKTKEDAKKLQQKIDKLNKLF